MKKDENRWNHMIKMETEIEGNSQKSMEIDGYRWKCM